MKSILTSQKLFQDGCLRVHKIFSVLSQANLVFITLWLLISFLDYKGDEMCTVFLVYDSSTFLCLIQCAYSSIHFYIMRILYIDSQKQKHRNMSGGRCQFQTSNWSVFLSQGFSFAYTVNLYCSYIRVVVGICGTFNK